jgi:hypothetical protein
MTTKQRALILDSLSKVEGESFVAYCIRLFVRNAHMKTDTDLKQTVKNLQDQAKDNRKILKRILGDQYRFLMSQKFTPAYADQQ